MRRLSSTRRAVSFLLACWLALFMAQPAPTMHACAVHDQSRPASQPADATHHSPMHGHQCSPCPGTCCPGFGARLGITPAIEHARIVAIHEPSVPARAVVRQSVAQIVLPPALGPPAITG